MKVLFRAVTCYCMKPPWNLLWLTNFFKSQGRNTKYALDALQAQLKPNSYLIQVSPYLSAGASASANTTPVASHVTAAAQASTRSHGVRQLLTAPMNASVSALVRRSLMRHVGKICRVLLFKLQPWQWTPAARLSSIIDALIWCCGPTFLMWHVWWETLHHWLQDSSFFSFLEQPASLQYLHQLDANSWQ